MSDPLRDRLHKTARAPSRPLDMKAVEARAVQFGRRTRLTVFGAAAIVTVAAVAVGLAVIPGSSHHTTRVTSTPSTITPAPLPSDQLVAIGTGGLRIIGAATGTVLRTVPTSATSLGPLQGPIDVDPAGHTAYANVSVSVSCQSRLLVAIDLQTGAQHQIAPGAMAPAVSPDGRWLAYLPLAAPDCIASQVAVRDLRTGAEQRWQIAAPAPAGRTPQELSTLHWTADSRHLVIGSTFAPATGIQVLDTTRPVAADNPHTVGPLTDSKGTAGGRYLDPAQLPNGQIAAIQPFCWGAMSCPPPISIGNGIVTLDPATGDVSSTVIDPRTDPQIQLIWLAIDWSGQRLAAVGNNDLYTIDGHTLHLVSHNIDNAAWLPATADVASPTSTTTTTIGSTTGLPTCASSELSLTPGQSGVGLGHVGVAILFRNIGTRKCTLSGYPGVAGLDASGRQATQVERTPSGYLGGLWLDPNSIPTVALDPGQVASALVEGTDNPVGTATSCPSYPKLLVTPPDETHSVVLDAGLSGFTGLPGCSALQVHPIVPGTTGTRQ